MESPKQQPLNLEYMQSEKDDENSIDFDLQLNMQNDERTES